MKKKRIDAKRAAAIAAACLLCFLFFRKVRQKMENREKAIDLIARTAYGEDGNGGRFGMQAVINVIDNRRKAGGWWGDTWEDVILKPYQFSIWNARTVAAYKNDPQFKRYLAVIENVDEKNAAFAEAKQLAAQAYDGQLPDITGGANHYKLPTARASWAEGVEPIAHIGSHDFYKL